jgi:hypothetical protein
MDLGLNMKNFSLKMTMNIGRIFEEYMTANGC